MERQGRAPPMQKRHRGRAAVVPSPEHGKLVVDLLERVDQHFLDVRGARYASSELVQDQVVQLRLAVVHGLSSAVPVVHGEVAPRLFTAPPAGLQERVGDIVAILHVGAKRFVSVLREARKSSRLALAARDTPRRGPKAHRRHRRRRGLGGGAGRDGRRVAQRHIAGAAPPTAWNGGAGAFRRARRARAPSTGRGRLAQRGAETQGRGHRRGTSRSRRWAAPHGSRNRSTEPDATRSPGWPQNLALLSADRPRQGRCSRGLRPLREAVGRPHVGGRRRLRPWLLRPISRTAAVAPGARIA
mmetsp:Transcript_108013/g.344864  ORF Transcript_108013/g.344864 Transcript_108013/m.344864 type:complete len:300 (+) Transcript_108013:651-1550(+)